MIKKFIKLISCIVLGLSFVGCATNAQFVNSNATISSDEILFANVAQALSSANYSLIESQLSNELKAQLNKEAFDIMVETLKNNGKVIKFTFVDRLKFPVRPSEIWKITMEKELENNELEYRERLLRVTYTELDGRLQIIAISIQ